MPVSCFPLEKTWQFVKMNPPSPRNQGDGLEGRRLERIPLRLTLGKENITSCKLLLNIQGTFQPGVATTHNCIILGTDQTTDTLSSVYLIVWTIC